MWILLIIGVLLLIYVLTSYNVLITRKNKLKQAYSGIDVYLTQRFNLIPNLVECVKGYMTHEQELLTQVTTMRLNYMDHKNIKDAGILNAECNRLIAITENYPELKASEQFLMLQKSLAKIESQLQAARRIYNMEVNLYNNSVQMFPSNLIANIFGFQEEEYFEAEEQEKENINI